METRFTWDPSKERTNKQVHGVSFETARQTFADPNLVIIENYYFEDDGEQRHTAIGMTLDLTLVVTIFVDRSEPFVEVIHIISARKAIAYEENFYEDQIA